MTWPVGTREKLEKLIPRLSSDQDGDIVSTIKAISRILEKNGMDWHDFTQELLSTSTGNQANKPHQKAKSAWEKKVQFCLNNEEIFKSREAEFLHDISAKLLHIDELTPRQAAWLESLYSRAMREHEKGRHYDQT